MPRPGDLIRPTHATAGYRLRLALVTMGARTRRDGRAVERTDSDRPVRKRPVWMTMRAFS
jgi:hypothetical protein